jgi:hypothetical protein
VEYIIVICAVGTAISSGLFAVRSTSGRQLGSMMFFLALLALGLVAVALGVTDWRVTRWRALRPLGLVLTALCLWYGSLLAGGEIREQRFERSRPGYEAVVEHFARGALPLDRHIPPELLPPEVRDCCYRVSGWRDKAGTLAVEFLTDGGWPARHSGYLYYAGDTLRANSAVAERWRRGTRLEPHWYWVSN